MQIDRRAFNGALIASLVFRRGWSEPAELPACPAGFEWVRSPALQACVACPRGWYFHEKGEDNSKTAFFTREDFAATDRFDTGFAVNVVTFLEGPIDQWCKAIVTICGEGIPPLITMETENDQFYSYGIEKINPPKPQKPKSVRIRVVGVGNKQTGTLYLVQFESPETQWETDWPVGRLIYDMFEINPAV
jgi:hypothetical protein